MKKIFTALALVLIVSACGGGGGTPPRNLDNACSIVSQRASWLSDMKSVERKWGIPVHVQMATIHQESKFVSDARTPFRYAIGVIPMGRQSSAYGFSQALDATWKEYQVDQRRFGAKREKFRDALRSQYYEHAVDFVFGQPVFWNNQLVQGSGAPKTTAQNFARKLVEAGHLRTLVAPAGRKPGLYVFAELLEIVDSP